MIETVGTKTVFKCGIAGCPYERMSEDPVEVRAVSSWHVYEVHPATWMARMGAQRRPKSSRPRL